MKALLVVGIIGMSMQLAASDLLQELDIHLEPIWQNLETNPAKIKQFGGKWILIGSITFKKRSRDTIYLNNLHLCWQGKPINNLIGTLYKKTAGKDFLPIEENVVCDGAWNNQQQKLLLTFDKQFALGLNNTFYLVLTVPETLEPDLRQGSFTLDEKSLPEPFKFYLHNKQLALAYRK